MQEKSERIALWDNLKFLLIVLVVMGHSLGNFMFQNDACKGVYIFIYFFHMPAFIFISGLFSKKTIKENKISKVTPYLLFYLLIKIISYLLQYGISGKYVPIDFLSESESPWFCLALFFMYIITMYTKRFRKGYVLTLALLLSCLAGYSAGNPDFLVWLRTVTFYPFFYLGYIWEPELIKERLCNIKFRVASVILLAAAFCLCVAYNNKFGIAWLPDSWRGIPAWDVYRFPFIDFFLNQHYAKRKILFFRTGAKDAGCLCFSRPRYLACIYLAWNEKAAGHPPLWLAAYDTGYQRIDYPFLLQFPIPCLYRKNPVGPLEASRRRKRGCRMLRKQQKGGCVKWNSESF